jgi:hypothetical protein
MNLRLTRLGKLILGALILAAPFGARAAFTGSKHDLNGQFGITKSCNVCHTPHFGTTTQTNAPLWNHKDSTVGTYTTYSSTTLHVGTAPQPGGTSKLCLSCHDGTMAVDMFGAPNGTGPNYPSSSTNTIGTINGGATNMGGTGGTHLEDDHPIGLLWDTSNPTLAPLSTTANIGNSPTKSGTILSNLLVTPPGQVAGSAVSTLECSSCHDVHNTFIFGAQTGAGMLKLDPTGSKICTTCHVK